MRLFTTRSYSLWKLLQLWGGGWWAVPERCSIYSWWWVLVLLPGYFDTCILLWLYPTDNLTHLSFHNKIPGTPVGGCHLAAPTLAPTYPVRLPPNSLNIYWIGRIYRRVQLNWAAYRIPIRNARGRRCCSHLGQILSFSGTSIYKLDRRRRRPAYQYLWPWLEEWDFQLRLFYR
jgi:hypothetical protein